MARFLTTTIKYGDTTAALRSLRRGLPTALVTGAYRHTQFAARVIKKDRFMPYPGPKAENPGREKLYSRTGKLRSSIKAFVDRKEGIAGVEAGRGLGDSRAHNNEYGAIIGGNPTVAVPLWGNLTEKTGQKKYATPAEAWASGGRTFWAKGGRLLLRRVAKGRIEPLFALADSVVIPPRLKLAETMHEDTRLMRHRNVVLRNAVRKQVTKYFGRKGLK